MSDSPSPLAEIRELAAIVAMAPDALDVDTLCEVRVGDMRFPVDAIGLGNPAAQCPAIAFVGGVHGLERIGSGVVLSFLRNLVSRLSWDDSLHGILERVRLVFLPICNPGGMWLGTRANPHGVDLMRNAPLESGERVPFLLGGQRLSPALPWYRGQAGQPMEIEARALTTLIAAELLPRRFSIALDCHSGFGIRDRIWFPFAHSRRPIPHLAEMRALKSLLDQVHCHHNYIFEPQSLQYLTHGDLWDHAYLDALSSATCLFLPLTLEMGSWLWVKKNPRQLLSRAGIFNPMAGHRIQRVMRRHLALMDFLLRAVASHARWLPSPATREALHAQAIAEWYASRPR